MKVKIQWFNGNGSRAGTEITTLEEIESRLAGGKASKTRFGINNWVFRLATGEVARVFVQ